MEDKLKLPGFVILDKPAGITSAKAIAIVKKKLNCDKIGHAGTLDPMATGVLVCLMNGATKFANFALAGEKTYSGHILLGTTTTTDDIEGEILTKNDTIPSFSEVQTAVNSFLGTSQQVPPQFSAVKKGGIPSYVKARKGEFVEISARSITITSFSCAPTEATNKISFWISCSKGTYIRSIARDLGEKLGCGGCLASLRREVSLPFTASQAKCIDDISREDILPWWKLLPETSMINLDPDIATSLRCGNQSVINKISNSLSGDKPIIYGSNDEWYGVLVKDELGNWNIAVNLA